LTDVVYTLVVAALIVGILGAVFYIPRFMVKMAARKVISIFRKKGATSHQAAVMLYDLGLEPKSFINRIGRTRDYKPYAVRLLGQAEVIKSTDEGLVWLDEAQLEVSPVKKFIGLKD